MTYKNPPLQSLAAKLITQNNLTPKNKITLLETPLVPNNAISSSTQKPNNTDILHTIKSTNTLNIAKRNNQVKIVLNSLLDLTMDPPLYWRKGHENDKGTSTEDLHENLNERDLKTLLDMANANTKNIEHKTERQIIATLSQEIAIKNQVIKGLENKLDQYEKRIRELETSIVDNKNGKDIDTLLIPTIDINHEMLMRKQDQIIEKLNQLNINHDIPTEKKTSSL